MFNKLPQELQNIILDYAIGCKKSQNFYINKEITNYICKKNKKCKCIHIAQISLLAIESPRSSATIASPVGATMNYRASKVWG